MPTNPEQFQQNRLPWSKWKHAILQKYLEAMVAILRSWGVIYFVDGFAGPGRYIEDQVDGSPLLAARHAETLASSAKKYMLKCINIESDPEVFENLQNSISDFRAHTTNFHGEFGTFVKEIINLVDDKPALFFLDPIGIKGLEWHTLLPVFHRESTTELLIRFDAQTATRLTGSDDNLHRTFNSILGEDNSRYWKRYIENGTLSPVEKKSRLTQAYEDKLKRHFEFVARMPIKSSDNQLKYHLLFATRSVKGVQVMNDVFCSISDMRDRSLDKEQGTARSRQLNMFEPSAEKKEINELENLKEAILKELKMGNSYKRDELRGYVASRGGNFGRFTVSQFTAVLGGSARGISVQKDFENLKGRIRIHNGLTLGNDKVEISLII